MNYFKGERFVVETIETIGEEVIVNGEYRMKDLALAYCNTSHGDQGRTHREPVNIYEPNLMTRENFYTACSRMEDVEEQLHLPVNFRNFVRKSEYDGSFKLPGYPKT